MKQVFDLINDAVELLEKCGWEERAEWFRGLESRLRGQVVGSVEFREELRSLRDILAGMGSFSDLPLTPLPGVALTEQEVKTKQWEIAEELGRVLQDTLNDCDSS